MKMSQDLFTRYNNNPIKCDKEVRETFGIPSDKYYTVSVYLIQGIVRVSNLSRHVSMKKISKSDQ